MRLDKYMSDCGAATRSEAKKLIRAGRVMVDGVSAKKGEQQVSEDSIVCLDGTRLFYRRFVYLMMNKPPGVVSATHDTWQQTVIDLLPDDYLHFGLFPVGRLDIDTEGLLILTNDGAFAHELTAPKKKVYKTYVATLDKPIEKKDIRIFCEGIALGEDFVTKPAYLQMGESETEAVIQICEGKFHQVKRMCAYVGKHVEHLRRIAIGGLYLDGRLSPGGVRELTEEEKELLKKERQDG